IRKISTSKGCRSLRSVDSGLRPNASEISLPAPLNFPFGEDHVSSAIFVVLTLCTSESCLTRIRLQLAIYFCLHSRAVCLKTLQNGKLLLKTISLRRITNGARSVHDWFYFDLLSARQRFL